MAKALAVRVLGGQKLKVTSPSRVFYPATGTAKTDIVYGIGTPAAAAKTIIEAVPQIVAWKMTYDYDGFHEAHPAPA